MIRVLHLLPSVGSGGTEAVAASLDLLARAHGVPSIVHPRLAEEGSAPWRRWVGWSLSTPGGASVIHAHLPWPDRLGAALLAARGRAMVITFHLLPDGAWPRDRVLGVDSRRLITWTARRPKTLWVALSRADRERLSALGLRARVVRNAPPAPSPPRDPVRFDDGVVGLASVGRLDPQKGFDRMLTALAPLRGGRWRWVIAGEGPMREALTRQIEALDLGAQVTLLGRRPALDVLTHAAMLLAPSRSEGMPLVPLEAIEAGVAVVASRIAPHEELLVETPRALLSDDPTRWTEALAAWIADADARDALRRAQRAIVGDDPRARLWQDYAALYREASEDR